MVWLIFYKLLAVYPLYHTASSCDLGTNRLKMLNKNNRRACFKTLALLALFLFAFAAPAEARYSHIIFDGYSGKVLDERDQHAARKPASLTKMMTIYLVFEQVQHGKVKWNTKLRVSKNASRQSPSKLGLNPGDTISVRDAVMALITRSANDIAVVVAEGLAGNEAKFAAQMTAKARKLGMTRTTFRNASGLPARGQITTARDMGVLGQSLIRDFPDYYKMFNTESFVFRGEEIRNHNHMLKYYPGLDGIKTGYIRASGFNLVASAEREGKRLIGVVMGGTSTSWRDRQMQKLLDAGFEKLGVKKAYAAYPVASKQSPAIKSDVEEDIPDSVADKDFTAQPDQTVTTLTPSTSDTSSGTTVIQTAQPATPSSIGGTDTTSITIATLESTSPPLETAEPAASQESTANNWSLQVGAYKTYNQARKAASMAKRLTTYADAEVKVLQYAKGRKRLYRARLYGLSEEDAQTGCAALKRHKLDCQILSPENKTS